MAITGRERALSRQSERPPTVRFSPATTVSFTAAANTSRRTFASPWSRLGNSAARGRRIDRETAASRWTRRDASKDVRGLVAGPLRELPPRRPPRSLGRPTNGRQMELVRSCPPRSICWPDVANHDQRTSSLGFADDPPGRKVRLAGIGVPNPVTALSALTRAFEPDWAVPFLQFETESPLIAPRQRGGFRNTCLHRSLDSSRPHWSGCS